MVSRSPTSQVRSQFGHQPLICIVIIIIASSAAGIDVFCNNTLSDASGINRAIAASAVGSHVVLHGTCLLNDTVVLFGERSYSGTSRVGTVLRQANDTHLQALVASDVWVRNEAWTGGLVGAALCCTCAI